jgi:hypothetical protein
LPLRAMRETARTAGLRFFNTKQRLACATVHALLAYNAAAFSNRLAHLGVEVNSMEAPV